MQETEIDVLHSYVYALKHFKAFSPCGSLHQFVLQDYDQITADLKVHLTHYVMANQTCSIYSATSTYLLEEEVFISNRNFSGYSGVHATNQGHP